jgi:hypothetical protein
MRYGVTGKWPTRQTFSGEYGTGMIRATLAVVPSRLPVLWVKVIVLPAWCCR